LRGWGIAAFKNAEGEMRLTVLRIPSLAPKDVKVYAKHRQAWAVCRKLRKEGSLPPLTR